MTNAQFKSSLQSELNANHISFRNPIDEVGEVGVNTFIKFTYPIDEGARNWLQNRFTNGVTFSVVAPYSSLGNENLALINTPVQNNKSTKKGFIVLLVLVGGGSYQPTFTQDNEETGEPELMFFDTEAEAQAEIQECINDCSEAVSRGDMSDAYTLDDYRVIPATLTGTKIKCTVDGENYEMEITEDDYTRV